MTSILLASCAKPYIAPKEISNTSKLEINLVTESFAGGVSISIGETGNCKTNQLIGGMKKGHTFMSDKDVIQTIIKSRVPITIGAGVADTILYACSTAIEFTPKEYNSYLVEFEYHMPQCELRLFNINNGKKNRVDKNKVKVCN